MLPCEDVINSKACFASAPRPTAADYRELKSVGYSPIEIAEIAYLAANNASGNRLATLLALPNDPLEEVEADWFDKLKRPFTRKDFRALLFPIFKVSPLPAHTGPGAEIVKAFEGSPAGPALATVLSGAWESAITSKRVKALVFGVIARSLGCEACEGEAAEALRQDGWTYPEIEHVLTYLDSKKLDSFELKALRFARETVRYQTRRVQELAQSFADGLERDVLLEIIGLVSYANGLARMSPASPVLTSTTRCLAVAAASLLGNAALLFALSRLLKRVELLAAAREKAALDLQNLQQAFHQFAPPRVVEEVIKAEVSTSGETREVTVLFADIVEFTAMSETLGPETLVRILNGYFEAACKAVTHHGGHIANFVGDGIMAIFGAPEKQPVAITGRCHSGPLLRKAIQRYNEDLARQSLPTLDVRIGIHKGTVVAGVVGSTENLDYTVIGDVVNTAARIENLTRKHGVDILIGAEVRPALDGRFEVRDLPPEQVKGKAEPIDTFAVEGFRGEFGDLD